MADEDRTREQLLQELEATRRRVAELEASGARIKAQPPEDGRTKQERSSRERPLRTLLQNAPVSIFATDLHCTVTFVGATVAGLDPESVPGTSMFDHIPPAYHDQIRSAVKRVLRDGGTESYEVEAVGPDDTVTWYETRVSQSRIGSETIGLIFTRVDITERNQAEKALLLTEKSSSSIWSSAVPIGYGRSILRVTTHTAPIP